MICCHSFVHEQGICVLGAYPSGFFRIRIPSFPCVPPMEREPASSVFALTPLFPCAACLLRSAAALRFPVLANQYNQSNAPLTGTHFFACLSQYRRSCCHSTEPQKGGSGREPLRERLQPSRQPDVLFFAQKKEQESGRMFFCKEKRSKANFAPTWRTREDSNLWPLESEAYKLNRLQSPALSEKVPILAILSIYHVYHAHQNQGFSIMFCQ